MYNKFKTPPNENHIHPFYCINIIYPCHSQTPRFVNPIEGIYGQGFHYCNYVDWEFASILDYECGSKTYDGHQGTDFTLKVFLKWIWAFRFWRLIQALLIAAHDGEFDREKVSDPSKGLGNYIGLKHSGDFFTYYGH